MSFSVEDPEETDEYYRRINQVGRFVNAEFYAGPVRTGSAMTGRDATTIRELDDLLDCGELELDHFTSSTIAPRLEVIRTLVEKARPNYPRYERRIYASIAPPGETKSEAKLRKRCERARQDYAREIGHAPRTYHKDRAGLSEADKMARDQALNTAGKAKRRDAARVTRDQERAIDIATMTTVLADLD